MTHSYKKKMDLKIHFLSRGETIETCEPCGSQFTRQFGTILIKL